MLAHQKEVISLLELVKVDEFYVTCYFRCKITKRLIISSVPFEPYDGKIEITWQEMLMHPFQSYDRYYHTPITIYDNNCNDTIVLKAFEKVSSAFEWSYKKNCYIFTDKDYKFEQKVS